MNEISVMQLKSLIPRVKIIDIRDNYQYNVGNIPTSKNIPKNFLLMNSDLYLNMTDTYYIYCEYGHTSAKVCEKLRRKGYNVVNVMGGYSEYVKF